MWLVFVPASVAFPTSCADCQAQEVSSGEIKLFLVVTTKNLSPWANQNLASGRIYCHLLVRGHYLFLPFFEGGVLKRFCLLVWSCGNPLILSTWI